MQYKHCRYTVSFNFYNSLWMSDKNFLVPKQKKGTLYTSLFAHGLRKSPAAMCLESVAWCSSSDLGLTQFLLFSKAGNATLRFQLTATDIPLALFFDVLILISNQWSAHLTSENYFLQISSVTTDVDVILL